MGSDLVDQVAAVKAATMKMTLYAREQALANTIANGVHVDGVRIVDAHAQVGAAAYWIAFTHTTSGSFGAPVLIRNFAALKLGGAQREPMGVHTGRFSHPVFRAGAADWVAFGAEVDAVAHAFQAAIDHYRGLGGLS